MFSRTLEPVRRHHRQQDRLKAKAAAVVDAMRCGQALHFHNDRWRGPVWWLSYDGRPIADRVAQLVIKNPAIVSVDEALPLGVDIPAQTFRYAQ
jgi:hypothetical protein